MLRISVSFTSTPALLRSHFIKCAANAFSDDPGILGPAHWTYKNGSPDGIYFKVSEPPQTYRWIVKRLTKVLLENNLSHELLGVSGAVSHQCKTALLRSIQEEAAIHEGKPPAESRPINRRPKLLPVIGYYLRDLCDF